ncbi:MAG TPA: AraC family transcriptional regulator [Bacteroidales bacterium]|nr:AraC family transcriptional regulator [Bacteroidales bacterium]
MSSSKKPVRKVIFLKNMVCHCCIRLLRKELERMEEITIHEIIAGKIILSFVPSTITWKKVEKIIHDLDFEIIAEKESILVEQLKLAVIELVHNTTYNSMINNSDFLVGKFNRSYPYLSAVFSKKENMTLEKFIIEQKIRKVRELIAQEDLTLSEIAFVMGYSSVQYLSTQFKKVTGISVTEFKGKPILTEIDD